MKRSKFNHTHVNSTTCKMGYAVPVMLSECLPGDTWQGDTQFFIRVAPMVAPLMHRVGIMSMTFFVPWRLVLPDFNDKFITGGKNGDDDTILPYVNITPTAGSLADYFGLPLTENPIKVSAAPFRAYNLIWNHFLRDQDLQDEIEVSLEPGEDTTTPTELLKANWGKDYFTTARPEPQKGPSITIPLVGDGGIVSTGPMKFTLGDIVNNKSGYVSGKSLDFGSNANTVGYGRVWATGDGNGIRDSTIYSLNTHSSEQPSLNLSNSTFGYFTGGLSCSLTSNNHSFGLQSQALTYLSGLGLGSAEEGSIGIDINDLLESMAMQKFATRRSLFGSRYEDLLHYWGLKTQDFRLQMPELVSVGRGQLQFSEVLQTTPDASGAGVGEMAGHGVGAMRSGRFRYYCHEHGFLMTLMVVRPQAVYTQGIERMWTRETRWDFWNPEMQHIGQQEVLSKEVYADGSEDDELVFGFQNRYDEYRRGKNHVTGEFRTTLDYWNMARQFENRPSLNSEFITCDPTDRIFQLSESLSDQLYCMINNKLLAKRMISRNGNPM